MKSTAMSKKREFLEEFPCMKEKIEQRIAKEQEDTERAARAEKYKSDYPNSAPHYKWNPATKTMEMVAEGAPSTASSTGGRCAACNEPFNSSLVYSIAGERVCANCWILSREAESAYNWSGD